MKGRRKNIHLDAPNRLATMTYKIRHPLFGCSLYVTISQKYDGKTSDDAHADVDAEADDVGSLILTHSLPLHSALFDRCVTTIVSIFPFDL